MLTSIVMPSLNQDEYIESAIRSILDQDNDELEVVVMDGGSTDQTQAILQRLGDATNGQLYWRSEPDQGPADAINRAIALSKGDVIGWLNADDVYEPNAISLALDALDRNPELVMVYGLGSHIDNTGKKIGSYPTRTPDAGIVGFADGCYICQPTVFFRREMAQQLGSLNVELKTTFDFEYWLRAFSQFPGRVGFIDRPIASSRLHKDCITRTQKRLVTLESIKVISTHLGYCPLKWFENHAYEIISQHASGRPVDETRRKLADFAKDTEPFLSQSARSSMWSLTKNKLDLILVGFVEKQCVGKTKARIPIHHALSAWVRARKDRRLLLQSGLFDADWYLSNYPEVCESGLDPVDHYLTKGYGEGKNPSRAFDTRFYLSAHPDVLVCGINPLLHYLRYGVKEGRLTSCTIDFD